MKTPPAFPTPEFFDEKVCGMQPGMTLRDWFAGQAMHGILHTAATERGGSFFWDTIAQDAYFMADAMMKARTKGCG